MEEEEPATPTALVLSWLSGWQRWGRTRQGQGKDKARTRQGSPHPGRATPRPSFFPSFHPSCFYFCLPSCLSFFLPSFLICETTFVLSFLPLFHHPTPLCPPASPSATSFTPRPSFLLCFFCYLSSFLCFLLCFLPCFLPFLPSQSSVLLLSFCPSFLIFCPSSVLLSFCPSPVLPNLLSFCPSFLFFHKTLHLCFHPPAPPTHHFIQP